MPFQAAVVQKRLEDAGFESKLAYGLTAVLARDIVGELEAELVTKEYLDACLAALRSEFKSELSILKVEVIKWMAGMIVGSTLAIIITLLRIMK